MILTERIRLLIHILRELGESHGITAEKLREAGQDVRRQITPVERLKVLDEIYTVRQAEERYLRGEICECIPGKTLFDPTGPNDSCLSIL
jgi:hypothetical protein